MYPDLLGLKGASAGLQVRGEIPGVTPGAAVETEALEFRCRRRNVWCSGEMHRYHTEHRLRRHLTNRRLTLMHESVGIEQD